MTFNDFLIIYLACGSPFGIYFFLNHQRVNSRSQLWLESFLIFAFWIPFAAFLVIKSKKFQSVVSVHFAESSLNAPTDNNLLSIQKQFEKALLETDLKISIYQLREILERYIGLTFATQDTKDITDASIGENEMYVISNNDNFALSSTCFNRRNRKRLFFHQKKARQDFLNVLVKIILFCPREKNLGNLSLEFVKLLRDVEAHDALVKLNNELQQTDENSSVSQTERKVIWIIEAHKPSTAKQLPISLRAMTATAMNSPNKD